MTPGKKSQKAWSEMEKNPSSRIRGPGGPQKGFCPNCNGALWIVKCSACDSMSSATCPKCGELGCSRNECPSRHDRLYARAAMILIGAAIGAGFWLYFASILKVKTTVNQPGYALYKVFHDQVSAYETTGDFADYKARARAIDPAENVHPYNLLLRNINHLFGSSASGEVSFKKHGLRPLDFLDMVYGHLFEGGQTGLVKFVEKLVPVKKGDGPRPGDLILYLHEGKLSWAVVATGKLQVFFVADTFERATLYEITEPPWGYGQLAVLRPPDSPAVAPPAPMSVAPATVTTAPATP